MKENTENEKNPLKKEENENIEFFLKEKKDSQKNIKKEENNKEQVNQSNNLYDGQEEHLRKLFYQQRHLFEHKKDKKDPLINIYSEHLKKEYTNEVNYIWRNLILTMILSTLVIIQNYLIIKNYKLYSEIIICFFTSFFAIFIASLLMIELYRSALRDQIRYKLFKILSLLLFITLFFLFIFQIKNILVIYNKIKLRKGKIGKESINDSLLANLLDKNKTNNIILILGYITTFGIILLIKFLIWLGYDFIRILFGGLEVFQKQILEDKKENKEVHQKQN